MPLPGLAQADAPPVMLSERAVCVQHPGLAATYSCRSCGAAICSLCDFPQPNGTHLCPNCASRLPGAPPLIVAMPEGARCVQHPNSPAAAKCKLCGGFMCSTCTFDLPGGIKLCPTCATAPPKLSPKRKKFLIGSYALAVWCTIVMAALFGGMFRGFVQDSESRELFGMVLLLMLPVPSLIGLSLGVSSMDKRLPNSIAMWIATVWNGVILAGFIMLIILGMTKGHGQ
jgi:hypothetical protein